MRERLLLIAVSVCVALLLAEVVARLSYSRPWTERLIEEQGRDFTFGVRLNRCGVRGVDPASTPPPGARRILVLGDSFTFGAWVEEEETFVSRLEAELNQRFENPVGPAVEVMNGGLPGSLTHDWLALYEKVRAEFNPDVILIVFFLRDGTRTDSIGQFFGPIRDEIVAVNRASLSYRWFHLWRVVKDARDRRRVGGDYTRAINRSYVGDAGETEEWRNAQRNLRKLVELANADSANVGLAIFPVLVELNDAYPFQAACDAIADFAGAEGIPVHDLLDAFRGEGAPSLWISPLDQHPNARAHAIAADSLLPFVAKLLEAEGERS